MKRIVTVAAVALLTAGLTSVSFAQGKESHKRHAKAATTQVTKKEENKATATKPATESVVSKPATTIPPPAETKPTASVTPSQPTRMTESVAKPATDMAKDHATHPGTEAAKSAVSSTPSIPAVNSTTAVTKAMTNPVPGTPNVAVPTK